MTELDIPPRAGRVMGSPGTKEWPGRNHPGIGAWLIKTFCHRHTAVVADPMCGVGHLWQLAPTESAIFGCEKEPAGVAIAMANGIHAVCDRAEHWTPPVPVDLVAFSPIYPNADHDSGNKSDLVEGKSLQSIQKLTGTTNLLPVFLQIATYCGDAPVAVIVRNWIQDGAEVDWVSDVEQSMRFAGFQVERFWRKLLPGPATQWKLSSGRQTLWVDKEIVLVGRRA